MSLFVLNLAVLLPILVSSGQVAATSVCYGDLGCFDDSLRCHETEKLESPTKINTQLLLYTPENPSTPQYLNTGDDSTITNSNFRAERATKILIHGFKDDGFDSDWQGMKDAFLSVGQFNIIIVDWSGGAKVLDTGRLISDPTTVLAPYSISHQNTRLVGRQIGRLTEKLTALKGAAYSSMHLIGHSLGAHVAGYAGQYVSGKYRRISGLDPAGPEFQDFSDPGCFVDSTDAGFVDLIHTDIVFGSEKAVGHQDFYPNGGIHQVGCKPFDHGCYHGRAIDYFTESITTSCDFLAYPCTSWASFLLRQCRKCGSTGCSRMGYYAGMSPARGSFMLGTDDHAPYCLRNSGVPAPLFDIPW